MSLYIHKSHNVTVLLYHWCFQPNIDEPCSMRRSTRRCETSVWGSRLAISSSSWRSAPTGIMCIFWCNRADLQRHQAGDDDQEPDSARDLSALSSGEEAVVGRGVLDGWLFCQHGWATRQRGHDQRLRQEARPGLPEATRKPPVGSLLKYPAACGGDPLFHRCLRGMMLGTLLIL